jgi:uncharacterized protein YjbJ (UPF0337 family)
MTENKPAAKAPAKKAAGRSTEDDAAGDADAAAGDVQEQVDEMNEQGFLGEAVDPVPNGEYALTSGPDSPAMEDDHTPNVQTVAGAPEAEPKR